MTTVSPLRLVEAGDERGRLAEVAAQTHDPRRSARAAWSRVSAANVPSVEPSSTKIASQGCTERLERGAQLVVEQCDAPLLVVHRDDDGDHGQRYIRRARDSLPLMVDLISLEEALALVLEQRQTARARSPCRWRPRRGRVIAEDARSRRRPAALCELGDGRLRGSRRATPRGGCRSSRASPPACPRRARSRPARRWASRRAASCRTAPMPSSPSSTLSRMTTVSRSSRLSARATTFALEVATSLRARSSCAQGTRLGPAQIGALAAAGLVEVSCARRPRVAVLATGTELRRPGEPLGPGEVYEANGVMLAAALASAGADVETASDRCRRRGGAPARARARARGRRARHVGRRLGRPARSRARGCWPSSASRRSSGAWPSSRASRSRSACAASTLVFGLPGNPVSSLVGAELFVRPALLALQGAATPGPCLERGVWPRRSGATRQRDEFVRARISSVGDRGRARADRRVRSRT